VEGKLRKKVSWNSSKLEVIPWTLENITHCQSTKECCHSYLQLRKSGIITGV
jgi:hypothetical protein